MKFSLSKVQKATLCLWINEVIVTTRLIIPQHSNPKLSGGVKKRTKNVMQEPLQMVFILSNITKSITIFHIIMSLKQNQRNFERACYSVAAIIGNKLKFLELNNLNLPVEW